jgi:hypothetical protein
VQESDASATTTTEKKAKKRRSLLDFFRKSDDELDVDDEQKKAKKDKSKKKDKGRKKDKVDTEQVKNSEVVKDDSNTQPTVKDVSPSKASFKTETDATSEKDTSGSSPTSSDWKAASSGASQTTSSPDSMAPSTASAGTSHEHKDEVSSQVSPHLVAPESPKKSSIASSNPAVIRTKTVSSVNSKKSADSKISVDVESKGDGGDSPKSQFDLSPGSDSLSPDHKEVGKAVADAGSIADSSDPELYPNHDNLDTDGVQRIIPNVRKQSRLKDGKEVVIPTIRNSSRMQDGKLKVIPKVRKDSLVMVDAEGKPLPTSEVEVEVELPAEPEPILEEPVIIPEVPLEPIITIDLSQSLPGDLIFNTFDCTASWIEVERGRAAAHRQWIQAMDQSVRLLLILLLH